MRRLLATALFSLAGLTTAAGTAAAQGALVHGSVAAALSGDTASPAFGGGVTWRFNKALGLGVELSHLRSLESTFAHIYCCIDDGEETRATVFTTNVRLEIPTMARRIVPFVVGGGGVAGVTESYSVWYAQLAGTLGAELASLGMGRLMAPILPGPSEIETTTTNMALTLGGGASFLLTDRVAIDADLRVLHIMGDRGRNIGRFGAGVSYRF